MYRFVLIFVLLISIVDVAFSQVLYERTYPFEFPSIQFPFELSDNSTFSLGTNNDCGGIGVRHIDQFGNEHFENAFWSEAFSSGTFWTGHDSVLIWAEEGAYDVGPDSFRVYIWTPGSVQKVLSMDIRHTNSSASRYGAFLYTTDRLVFEKTDTLYAENLVTNQIDKSLVVSGISFIHELEKAILVISYEDTPVLLDPQLNEIIRWQSATEVSFALEDAAVLDSFLISLSGFNDSILQVINVYTEDQRDINLSSYLDHIDEVQVNKNQLFVKGESLGEDMVIQINSKLEIIEVKYLGTPMIDKIFTYRYYPDRVYAWSTDGQANYVANYRICYPYTDPSPIQYIDLALDTMWVDSVRHYAWHYNIFYIQGIVSNHSMDVVHTYTLHYEEIPFIFCDPGVYGGPIENRNIEPNSMDTFSLVLITDQFGSTYSQRFYLHHGNHHLDSLISDNNYYLVHLLDQVNEPSPISSFVYPNPFTDFIKLSKELEEFNLELYNIHGQRVAFGKGELNNLSDLPAGMYYLNVQMSDKRLGFKVIKSE